VLVDVRVNKVLRQYSRTNDSIDEGFLCDRGRWNTEPVNSPQRLRTPLIRRNGALEPATWDEALQLVAQRLRAVASTHGAAAIGGIGSTHTTNEEAYLFQKLLRAGLGTNTVDHYHGRFPALERDGLPWVWTDSIAGLEKASVIVLLGTPTGASPSSICASGEPYARAHASMSSRPNRRGWTVWPPERFATARARLARWRERCSARCSASR
jgi:predicted molibdopterin-dependent oxidoreductase YjgC